MHLYEYEKMLRPEIEEIWNPTENKLKTGSSPGKFIKQSE